MNKKLSKLIVTICSLVFATSTVFLGASLIADNLKSAKAYEISFENEEALQSEYSYGESIVVPMGSIEGAATSKFVVVSPSGKVSDSANLALQEAGQYTIIWYANLGGKEVSAKKNFLVTQSAFSVEGGVQWEYVDALSKVSEKTSGVKVSLEPESTFRYNTAIDLSDASVPFIHVFPYQGITNIAEATDKSEYQYCDDARNYLFTLTDCYDPNNYITIDLEWQEDRTYFNMKAGAVGQVSHGLRTRSDEGVEKVLIDGTQYQWYLAPAQGLTSCNVTDDYGIKFYYDIEKNNVYVTFWRYANGKYTVCERLLADLDNETIYPNNPFKGFTTGEVYLSISAKNHLSNTANMEIASIGGVSGENLLAIAKDTAAPILKVNEELLEKTSIALNEEITIPDAYALDINLPYGTKATTAVYYAYDPDSENNTLVGLSGGKFTPKKQGFYTVVYTAADRSGNVATATVELQCVQGIENKAVKLSVAPTVEADAGTYTALPECTVDGLYTDESAVQVYLQLENGEQKLLQEDQIFLNGAKEYKLVYVYTTPFKVYTATSVINAKASEEVTMDKIVLPEYFIKNASYTLNTVYAYEYKTKEPARMAAKVFMSADGGEYAEVDGKAVSIKANETVQFKFEHNGKAQYSDTVKVVDVGFGGELALQKYFHSEEDVFTSSASGDGVRYVTNGAIQQATLKYVNVLSLPSFAIEFTLLGADKNSTATYNAPASITFTLVDYYDRTNAVRLSFVNAGETTKVYVNDQQAGSIAKSLLDTKTSVVYENGFRSGGAKYAWDGSFTSDKMLLWVTLEGMEGATCLNINKLCDKKLTAATNDKLDPILYVSKSNTGYQALNKVITIVQAKATDVIAPYLESGLHLTVRKPDGTYATSVDGVVLDGTCPVDRDYELKLTEIGIYSVLYEYRDQNNGGYSSFGYSPIVKDQVPPVLKVEGVSENEVQTAKWGATVQVASYTVSDDISEGEGITAWIIVFYPSNIAREVENGGSFYAEEKGDYTVLYQAFDEVGNFTTFAYVVRVA